MFNKKAATTALTMAMAASVCAPLATPVFADTMPAVDETSVDFVDETKESAVDEELSFSGNTIDSFLTNLYINILGREPDEEGLAAWRDQLASGSITAADAIKGFVKSNEFKNHDVSDAEFIQVLYRAIFGREADAAGLTAWKNVIRDGGTRMRVLQGLVKSHELRNLCEEIGVTVGTFVSTEYQDVHKNESAFIARLYQFGLGRSYDEESMQVWVKSLVDGSTTASEAVRGFFFCGEMKDRNLSNEAFARVAYQAILNRNGSESEVEGWVKQLDKGMERTEMIDRFIKSDEFAKICDSIGIEVMDQEEEEESVNETLRSNIAAYAQTFVGRLRYVYGGASLKTGADCSGFVQQIFKRFGISLPRTSGEQGSTGRRISTSQLQAGDIIYYGGHVAIYIGDGKVCHASSAKTGIKISNYNYRSIVSCRNVID